jgi:hypothetical protein
MNPGRSDTVNQSIRMTARFWATKALGADPQAITNASAPAVAA